MNAFSTHQSLCLLLSRVISLFSLFFFFCFAPVVLFFCILALLKWGGFIKKLVLSLYYRLDGVSGTDATVNNRKLGFKNKTPGDLMHGGKQQSGFKEGMTVIYI